MEFTDQQLKEALAKALPDLIQIKRWTHREVGEITYILWRENQNAVSEREWLWVCQQVCDNLLPLNYLNTPYHDMYCMACDGTKSYRQRATELIKIGVLSV